MEKFWDVFHGANITHVAQVSVWIKYRWLKRQSLPVIALSRCRSLADERRDAVYNLYHWTCVLSLSVNAQCSCAFKSYTTIFYLFLPSFSTHRSIAFVSTSGCFFNACTLSTSSSFFTVLFLNVLSIYT